MAKSENLMLRLLLVLNILFVVPGFAQEQVPFSEALSKHLPKYTEKADKAYRYAKVERAEFLFDSLVNYCLKGTRLDNFRAKDLKQKEVRLNEFNKPLYLLTSASWVVSAKGEIPALNKLADEYGDQIDFVLLFWDDHNTAKDLSKQYSKNIKVLYVDESLNKNPGIIKVMKHSFGFPTSFLLDKNKLLIDIRRKVSHPYNVEFERSFELNFESFSNAISLLLVRNSSQYSANLVSEEKNPVQTPSLQQR